ncbi:cytochrome c maturation protein CcmE [Frigidibacter sp. ROC022]|uniref:cytochrome c maturation protein CcmE n=1 Tax=Frigidibacter sp. ROC022 TaxID=2971796 RepID=UPI00215ADE4E|nr:cytochrome c maturation protein CcmE [Frigidibacter sp. ROC022]MCR8725459.1 cytochrome c maturation protein CcmE [Frigidibacter sp. ROC022]
MLGLKKRRRVQIILLAVVALALSTALIGYAMRDGINFFRSPTQVLEAPPGPAEVFRIGGLVEEGSLVRGEGTEVSFRVTDMNASVPVRYSGVLPDLFGEGEGVVAMGRYDGSSFIATEILAKHDESYMPKEVVDALKDQGVYVEPEK